MKIVFITLGIIGAIAAIIVGVIVWNAYQAGKVWDKKVKSSWEENK